MRIKAYIRLQRCTTSTRSAFVNRRARAHGVAAGSIGYYAVEGTSWSHIRRILKTFDVIGFSACDRKSVQGFVTDIGRSAGSLRPLRDDEVPAAVRFERVQTLTEEESKNLLDCVAAAPELSSFGPEAVEVLDPNVQTLAEPAAVLLGRRGGVAAAASLTPKQRAARARKAGRSKRLTCNCGKCRTCRHRKYQRQRRKEMKR